MRGAQRKAIHRGIVEARQRFGGDNRLGHYMAKRRIHRHRQRGLQAGALADGIKGLLEGNHGAPAFTGIRGFNAMLSAVI